MKPGGGKRKGASFEREVCTKLSLWVSGKKRADLFWRSAMSGGRARVAVNAGRRNRTQGGDITAVGLEGHSLLDRFSIECKHVADLGLVGAILNHRGPLMTYWRQCKRDAITQRKLPLLIARQNRLPTLAIVPSSHLGLLGLRVTDASASIMLDGGDVSIVQFDRLLGIQCPFEMRQE